MIVERYDEPRQIVRALWAQFPYYTPTLMLLLFGHTLWLPGDTFANSPAFAGLAGVMTEDHWGYVMMGVAAGHFAAVALRVRWLALAFLAGTLFVLAYLAFSISANTPVPSTGLRAYLLYVALAIWSFSHWDVKWRRT